MKLFNNIYHTIAAGWHSNKFESYVDKKSKYALDSFNKMLQHEAKIK